MPDFELVDQNLRAALKFFGQATGTGEVRALAGVDAYFSGLDYGVFNIAVLSQPVGPGTTPLEERIAECARYFKSKTNQWSFWVCEELLDTPTKRRAKQAFAEGGMRVISQPPGMMATGLRMPERLLPDIECLPVADLQTRDAFASITSVAFDIPSPVSRSVYQTEGAWQGSYRGYVGIVRGRPVSMVALVPAGGVLGIYSLATLPDYRRAGYGEALLRAAISRERRMPGERLVLQSTEAGYRLYRRLGFRDVAKFAVYLTR